MKNTPYTSLARYYDRLGERPDFAAYADFVIEQAKTYAVLRKDERIAPRLRILDLACGTGSLTVELARKNAFVIGADISPEMLAEADRKIAEEGLSTLLICQDMRRLTLANKVDAAVCATDSLNYLTKTADLAAAFGAVADCLVDGGLFVFDLNSRYTFEHVYGERDYVLEDGGILCAWRNFYNPRTKICDFELDIFERAPDGRYDRYRECQRERYFPRTTVERELRKAGFELLSATSDFHGTALDEESRREYYVAAKSFSNKK